MSRVPATGLVFALLLAALVGAPVTAALGGSGYLLVVATRGAVLAIAAVSLQFMLGFGGLVSFGHAAVVGIGAYAVLASAGGDALWVLPLAMAAAAAFAGLTGLVSLRTQGVTYIMITLAFGQMAYFVAAAWAPFGGDDGMALEGRSPLLGLDPGNGYAFHAAVVACLAAWGLVLRMLAGSRFGRALRASAGNATRAAALGYNVARLRLAATAIGGAGGGLAGFWLANTSEFVSPAILDWRASGHMLAMVILGSRGPLARSVDGQLVGAAAGAVGLVAAEDWLASVTGHGALVIGPVLLVAALLGPRR